MDVIEPEWSAGSTGEEDDTSVGFVRTQELIVRHTNQGLETKSDEASATRDSLKEDLCTAPATGTVNPVTEGIAPGMPPEGLGAAKQEPDIHSPVSGPRVAQTGAQEASTLTSILPNLPVVNRRLPPAFILQAERQAATEYRAKVERSRLRRDGRWGA